MLEAGELSEGHGRALLAAKGQDKRRALARRAASEGWSVRETERRAKGEPLPSPQAAGSSIPTRRRRSARPRMRSSERSATTSGSARGARGLTAQIRFEDLDEALALAKSLRRK